MSRLYKLLVAILVAFAGAVSWLALPAPAQAAGDVTPPSAPGTPTFSNVTAFSVTLSWTPSTDNVGVSNYLVRRLLLNGQTWTDSTTGAVTTITIRDLTPNQGYTFTVIATDAAANTAAAPAASVRTLAYTAGPLCSVRYQASTSGGSFFATVDMTNQSTGPWQEWTLGFTLTDAQRINPEWGFQQNGNRWTTFFVWLWTSNAGPLMPGATRSVSFAGTFTGSTNPAPTNFTINDQPCGLNGPIVPPGVPPGLVVTSLTPTSAGIRWNAATPGTNPISRYEVLLNAISYPCAGTDPSACLITGLTPGTTYAVSVRAVDTTGLVGAASTISVTTPPAGGGCRVAYSTNDWAGGFTATVVITNTGATAINGWTLRFAFPAGQRLTQGWNARWSQPVGSPNVTATNLDWNATIQPGASVSIGFNGTFSGTNPRPTAFTVNGNACT